MSLFRKFLALCDRSRTNPKYEQFHKRRRNIRTNGESVVVALENSYVVFLLQPYYKNFSKRIIKSPKLTFMTQDCCQIC